MPTPFESAQLILTLYDQRREETLRKARDFVFTLNPQSFDELKSAIFNPENAYLRMVLGYWEMAASLVNNGAIDSKMFQDSTLEFVGVYAKIEPYVEQLRQVTGNPGFAAQLQQLTLSLPNAQERIETMRQRMAAVTAARSAQSARA